MLHLIPAPLHRLALRWAHAVRRQLRRTFKLPIAGVTVVATDEAGRVLLVRHSYGPAGWSLPGGGLRRGEDPRLAAAREVREELRCGIAELNEVASLDETLSGAPHRAWLFHARLAGTPEPDGREIVEARFFARDALPTGVSRGAARRLERFLAGAGS